jgi:integrase
MKALTQEEIHKVLKVAAESKRNPTIIVLGLKHGMRASEISNLELKDVDLKNDEITIRRLKGSLKTTQPLADVQGQHLLSEKRVLRAWLEERGKHPSPRGSSSPKRVVASIVHNYAESSQTLQNGPGFRGTSGTSTS